jgi:hypothetical protein
MFRAVSAGLYLLDVPELTALDAAGASAGAAAAAMEQRATKLDASTTGTIGTMGAAGAETFAAEVIAARMTARARLADSWQGGAG